MSELRCPCGASIIPGSLATVEYLNAWKTEHAGHERQETFEYPATCQRKGRRVVVTNSKEKTDALQEDR